MGALSNLGGGGGGGASPRQQGADLLGRLSSQQGQQDLAKSAIGAVGGPQTQAAIGILEALGARTPDGGTDPIMGSLLMSMLEKQKRPRFENVMSDVELEQYRTGERRPDYRGTAAPGTPRVTYSPRFAQGGYIEGPGTGTSDSIPAMIYQNGGPVQEARLSDGEFVMTEAAVRGAGNGDRNAGAAKMYRMMNQFERMA
jgi:hypothetical protein